MTLRRMIQTCLAAGAAVMCLTSPAFAAAIKYNVFCDGTDPASGAERLIGSAETAPQLAADRAAAQPAIAKVDELRRRLTTGEAMEEPYAGVARSVGLSRSAGDPAVAELHRRAALDQFGRNHLTAAATRTSWAAGLSDGALQIAYTVVASRDGCVTDADNTRWLKQRIAANGWFKRSTYGDAADNAAFLLVQHADQDKPFQKQVLQVLEPLLATQDTRPANYALLFDRVAVGEGRPQRYGSQGRCTGPGTWTEQPIENPESVDQRRAGVGLEPMAAYRQRFVRTCA